jgi:hypothetical protein
MFQVKRLKAPTWRSSTVLLRMRLKSGERKVQAWMMLVMRRVRREKAELASNYFVFWVSLLKNERGLLFWWKGRRDGRGW